ncbi:hypothetical protein WJ02_21520 [Burkholderia vietnamiensis]|nr:hypothetical protein WJ02_21520 [Burkholderia vietnamiensis]
MSHYFALAARLFVPLLRVGYVDEFAHLFSLCVRLEARQFDRMRYGNLPAVHCFLYIRAALE